MTCPTLETIFYSCGLLETGICCNHVWLLAPSSRYLIHPTDVSLYVPLAAYDTLCVHDGGKPLLSCVPAGTSTASLCYPVVISLCNPTDAGSFCYPVDVHSLCKPVDTTSLCNLLVYLSFFPQDTPDFLFGILAIHNGALPLLFPLVMTNLDIAGTSGGTCSLSASLSLHLPHYSSLFLTSTIG